VAEFVPKYKKGSGMAQHDVGSGFSSSLSALSPESGTVAHGDPVDERGAGLEPVGPAPPTARFDLKAWRKGELARLRRAPGYRELPPYTKRLATYLIQRYYRPGEGLIVSQVTLEAELRHTKLKATRKTIGRHLKLLVAAGIFTCKERYRPTSWSRGGRTSNRYRVNPNLPSHLPSQLPSRGLTTERVSLETKETSLHSVEAGSASSPAKALGADMTNDLLAFDGSVSDLTNQPSKRPLNNTGPTSVDFSGGASTASFVSDYARGFLVEFEAASNSPLTKPQLREIESVDRRLVDDWAYRVAVEVTHGHEYGVHIEKPIGRFLAGIRTGKGPQ
jgi:hypothetical protein